MRLIRRKIWRAFPELDSFDDETCARYTRRVWGSPHASNFWLILIATVLFSWVVWLLVMITASAVFDLSVFPELSPVLHLMVSGFVWLSIVFGYIARDIWLSKQLRKQIDGAICKACQYSLVGLSIASSGSRESIRCPECGTSYELDGYLLTSADIDPMLISNSEARPSA